MKFILFSHFEDIMDNLKLQKIYRLLYFHGFEQKLKEINT